MILKKKICSGLVVLGAAFASAGQLAVVNYAETPVYATAVTIPADKIYPSTGLPLSTPMEAVDQYGRNIPLELGEKDGREVVRAYLSLKPGERLDLDFSRTEGWANSLCSGQFDPKTGCGFIRNGILRIDYADNQWKLSFDGSLAGAIAPLENRELIKNCGMDLWLDTKHRGRLLGYKPDSLHQMGLIHTSEARLVSGEATVGSNGSVALKLVRTFDGFAKNVTWTQTYTLVAGLPQVVVNIDFTVADDSTLYLAYINQGSGLAGRYGELLRSRPLFNYFDPKEPTASITGGAGTSLLRVAWRNERCWLGFAASSGAGLGISTLEETRDLDRGATVWNVNPNDFRITLLENERKYFPFDLSRERPFSNGLTLLGTSGDIDIWHQAKDLFKSQAQNKPLNLMQSYAVFLDGEPLQAGFVNKRLPGRKVLVPTSDQRGLQAAVQLCYGSNYLWEVQASGASASNPVMVEAAALSGTSKIESMHITDPKEKVLELSNLQKSLGAKDEMVDLVLTSSSATGGMAAFSLAQAAFAAPELSTPRAEQHVTDYALFFRWKKVPRAIDYEVQWARDATFTNPQSRTVRLETLLPFYMPKDGELPAPGIWYWRVRVLDGEMRGAWSEIREMTVNNDHSRKPLQYGVSPQTPLFTFEGFRVGREEVGAFKEILPKEMRPFAAFVSHEQENLIEYYQPFAGSDMRFFARPMHPFRMAETWGSLSEVEALFQSNPNAMGVLIGEAMSALYKGGEETLFAHRLIQLCAKYGKLFYIADGTYPKDNKWDEMYKRCGDFLLEYRAYLAFAQKNNILQRQMLSQSATLGLYLSGACVSHGAWEDGGWYWQQVGFRKLGEFYGRRGGDVRTMPRIFWCLNFVMGLSHGTTIFSLDGQTGTAPPTEGELLAVDAPLAGSPSAYWTRDGKLLPAYREFIEPLLDAIIEHQLIPTKEQVLANVRLAIYNDGVGKTDGQESYYRQYQPFYAGTYGFKPMGGYPGELYEFFPNTGRYHYIPVLPQGRVSLGNGIEVLPLSKLSDADRVHVLFNAAYPEWYRGDALVELVGDTLTVLNSNENLDERQGYSLQFANRGVFTGIEGRIDVHSYLVGKFEDGNKTFWIQTNAEYPERVMEFSLACRREPDLKVVPADALVSKSWSEGALHLKISYTHGAVEIEAVEQ